jgi:ABC-2 type transport system permease protein
MTLVGNPRVIFLDEPTTGLDPRSRRTMWQTIGELVAGGATILLTTQDLDEADQLADRIAVLDRGPVVAADTSSELKRRVPGGHVELRFTTPDALNSAASLLPASAADRDQLSLQIAGGGSVNSVRTLLNQLADAHVDVDRFSIHTPDLDDVFFVVTGDATEVARTAAQEVLQPMTLTYTLTDSATMLRRNLKHQARYPSLTLMLAGFPILFLLLLLFVCVFGGQLGAGLGASAAHPDLHAYLTYLVPGILVMTVASAALGTAIAVAMDMTEGIIDRFRTMAIRRSAVLTGHVVGTVLQTVAVLALVLGVALAIGFRTDAGPLHWLAAIGVLLLFAVALIWLSVALGLAAKSVETASNTPMFLTLLPLLSSGFVPTSTMPTGLRQFAEYQPFTPVTQTVRGLLVDGGSLDIHAAAAVAWSLAIAVACYL